MPVTARLSKQFYDRLGEAVTNELVDWFNQVDAAYKFDLREMNELNFARFDAKLEQRMAEVRAEIAKVDAKIDQRVAELRADIAKVEARLNARIDVTTAELRETIQRALNRQNRFFFVAWATQLAAIIALYFR
jgi:uncharacterized protein YicC (UPF0701 family)